MSYHTNLNSAQKELQNKLTKVCRAGAIEIFNAVIVGTPVNTGRARGNWFCTLNQPYMGTTEDTSQQEIKSKVNGYKLTDTMYLTNNLPYIEPLELGHSQQQPSGWVRVAVAEGQQLLNNKFKEIEQG